MKPEEGRQSWAVLDALDEKQRRQSPGKGACEGGGPGLAPLSTVSVMLFSAYLPRWAIWCALLVQVTTPVRTPLRPLLSTDWQAAGMEQYRQLARSMLVRLWGEPLCAWLGPAF